MRIRLLLLLLAAVLLSSCSGVEEQGPVYETAGFSRGLDAKESPMLSAMVAAGDLPPLEERLPEEPLVVEPVERLGEYGGTWRKIHARPDYNTLKMVLAYSPLIRWNPESNGIEPGLAKSYEYRDDGRTLVLHLRKGLRWSDGHPFTSEDIRFWYDLCEDDRVRYAPPGWSFVNAEPMKVEAPDPYTIVMRFNGPNFFAHLQLATGYWSCEDYLVPKHYMIQFHPDHNPEYKDFVEFEKMNLTHSNPDRPTMGSWMLKSIDAASHRLVFERNPYCYMVDTEGRQLPYIDYIHSTLVQDGQVRMLRMLAGEVDAQWRSTDLTDLSLFVRGQKRGNYRIKFWDEGYGAWAGFMPNWDHPDPVMRTLMRDKRFRQALSHAVPREKINQVSFKGMAEPQNCVVSDDAWHFQTPEGREIFEKWRRVYSEYDLDRANALLDDIGLKRDAQGYRLRTDGKRLTLIIMTTSTALSRFENDQSVMVAEEWRKLGIRVIVSTPPAAEVRNRRMQGNFDISTFTVAEMDLFTFPDWVFPTGNRYWHPLTGRYYETGGREGIKPEGLMKQLLDIFDRIKSEPDIEECHKLVHEAIRLHIKEGPAVIGTVGRMPSSVFVKNNFHNVPPTGVLGPWAPGQPGASYPEQFFMTLEEDVR